jgi:hypothetical protein
VSNASGKTPGLILGLPLPVPLRVAIAAGRWVAPADHQLISDVFADEVWRPCFYGPAVIEHETLNLIKMHRDYQPHYVGIPPDDIDLNLCLLIGDLGLDQPFALDYRRSAVSPPVLYLRGHGWTEVAANVETLMARLRMGPAA